MKIPFAGFFELLMPLRCLELEVFTCATHSWISGLASTSGWALVREVQIQQKQKPREHDTQGGFLTYGWAWNPVGTSGWLCGCIRTRQL